MQKSILFTQGLQNDFVKPIGRYDKLPNLLHIGYEESIRLMGLNPAEGPVTNTMKWAYSQSEDDMEIIHIRAWYNKEDPSQKKHLDKFGDHCIALTEGARFAFKLDKYPRITTIIDSNNQNDFLDTELKELLEPYKDEKMRVGIMGVWTEAKVSYLAYDLTTRYPNFDIAICSALTAGSSRSQHYYSLDQLERLLGVRIIPSIGEFTNFLSDVNISIPLPLPKLVDMPKIEFEEGDDIEISKTDNSLIRYLFRDCKSISLKTMTGGYSGNLVLSVESIDLHGHKQTPHVLKIGNQKEMGQERGSFEKVEAVLGNTAPRISDFADLEGRGALKYRYAAMSSGSSTTFQKMYCSGISSEKTKYFLDTIFKEQLGRFYFAANFEPKNLLEYYSFTPDYAPRMKMKIEKLLGADVETTNKMLTLPTGQEFPNPYYFYKDDLPKIIPSANFSSYFSYVHGDLNGANIIIDSHENVWLIDFFHTGEGHVLRDLLKLENDLLYIYTPINNEDDLEQAIMLTHLLLEVEDLRRPLPDIGKTKITNPDIIRTYETIKIIRSYYPKLIREDRNPLQLLIGQFRYSCHTLSFFESNNWQKRWALYATGWYGQNITNRIKARGPLRVDFLDKKFTGNGELGMTILPGRKDNGRVLEEDLKNLKEQGITHIVTLITDSEFTRYGVEGLMDEYKSAGFITYRLPIIDQGVCSQNEMDTVIKWIGEELNDGANIMIHCVGGLGRTGIVAASFLIQQGLSSQAAIDEVRSTRSKRSIESEVQELFVYKYKKR